MKLKKYRKITIFKISSKDDSIYDLALRSSQLYSKTSKENILIIHSKELEKQKVSIEFPKLFYKVKPKTIYKIMFSQSFEKAISYLKLIDNNEYLGEENVEGSINSYFERLSSYSIYKKVTDVLFIASKILVDIATHHYLNNGNKRISLFLSNLFLKNCGYYLSRFNDNSEYYEDLVVQVIKDKEKGDELDEIYNYIYDLFKKDIKLS